MQVYNVENSSTIKKLFYEEMTRVLTVEFLNGSQYKYQNVSKKEYDDFTNADSKGRYLSEVIKQKETQKVQQLND